MKQLPLFNDRVPLEIEYRGRKVVLPDGIADETDPLFISYGNEADAFLKENGLYRTYEHRNRLSHQGTYNVYTRQASFQFCFYKEDDDFTQVLKAWQTIKPLLRRFPHELKKYSGKFYECYRFTIFEPSLSEGGAYSIFYIDGQGWFADWRGYEAQLLSTDDLEAFRMLRDRFGWPKEDEAEEEKSDEEEGDNDYHGDW